MSAVGRDGLTSYQRKKVREDLSAWWVYLGTVGPERIVEVADRPVAALSR